MRNYWLNLLGCSNKSTQEEIKKAYRKKAVENHPDRNPSPEATKLFKEINNAYHSLINLPQITKKLYKQSDIWDAPNNGFIDTMEKEYGSQQKETPFLDSMKYKSPVKIWITKKEPEINLWKNNDPLADYWKEYNRLKKIMVYEDSELFWNKLDEWVKINIKSL